MGREILMGAFLELNTSHEKCRLISTQGKNTIKRDADKDEPSTPNCPRALTHPHHAGGR